MVKTWLYRWLPIFFGCHCRADRSFFYHGKQFPICARCTGELAGMMIAIVTVMAYQPDWRLCVICLFPLFADGFIQLCTPYESYNLRRLWTGCLFGYGFMMLLFQSAMYAYSTGYTFGLEHFR